MLTVLDWREPSTAPHHGGSLGPAAAAGAKAWAGRQQWCRWKPQRGWQQPGQPLALGVKSTLAKVCRSPSFLLQEAEGCEFTPRCLCLADGCPTGHPDPTFPLPSLLEPSLYPVPFFLTLQPLGEDLSFCPHPSELLRAANPGFLLPSEGFQKQLRKVVPAALPVVGWQRWCWSSQDPAGS